MRILWGDSWESVGSGGFALATAGDSVLLYCLFDDGRINHLGGLMSGTWAADDSAVDGTNQSQKPNSLDEVGAIEIIGGWDNLLYTGTRRGSKDALLMALADSSNWKGSNSEQFIFSEGNFEILGESSTKQGITNHEELASDSSSGLLTIWVGNLSTTLLAFILSLT